MKIGRKESSNDETSEYNFKGNHTYNRVNDHNLVFLASSW